MTEDTSSILEKIERSTQQGTVNPEFRNSLMYLNNRGPQLELRLEHTQAVINMFEKVSKNRKVLEDNLYAFELAKYMANSIDGRSLNVFTTKRAILEQRGPREDAGGASGGVLSSLFGNKNKQPQGMGGGL